MSCIRVLALFLLLLRSCAACSMDAAGRSLPPPAAATAGYRQHTFSSPGFDKSNVDANGTYARGYQWYLTNFLHDPTPPSAIILDSKKHVASISDSRPQQYNGALSTMAEKTGSPGFVGIAFGCGAYIDGVIRFDDKRQPSKSQVLDWPSFWVDAAEYLLDLSGGRWQGPLTDYKHWLEMDIMEKMRPGDSYQATLHDWFGVKRVTCPGSDFCETGTYANNVIKAKKNIDWSKWHHYAVLWVPASQSKRGGVQFYFDGDHIPSADTVWGFFDNQVPRLMDRPSPRSRPHPDWTYAVGDKQHFVVLLGSGSSSRVDVRSVDVWQGPGACNIQSD